MGWVERPTPLCSMFNNHIHRRSLTEFTGTGIERTPRIGEWYHTSFSAEQCAYQYQSDFKREILRFKTIQLDKVFPDREIFTSYHCGFIDGWECVKQGLGYDATAYRKMYYDIWDDDFLILATDNDWLLGVEDGQGELYRTLGLG
jgi:hypothetical protein